MKKRLIPILIFIAYGVALIKIMVFKDIPLIRVGHVMLNFGGINEGHGANFVPFKTILPYLLGYKGLMIAGINLVGNIAPLVPIGFLLPLVYLSIAWKKGLAIAVASGLVIEVMQVILRVGIFDIDDVILNALGVMIGYWAYIILAKWWRVKNCKNITIAAIVLLAAVATAFYLAYPWGQPASTQRGEQPVNPGLRTGSVKSEPSENQVGETLQGSDPCGGTGGNGQIVSKESNSFVMKRNDGRDQIVHLGDQISIETSAGTGSESDLEIGDRVTLVGGPNPDSSFTADTVAICARR